MRLFDSIVRFDAEELRQNPKLEAECVLAHREDRAIVLPKREGRWQIMEIQQGMDHVFGRWLTLSLIKDDTE